MKVNYCWRTWANQVWWSHIYEKWARRILQSLRSLAGSPKVIWESIIGCPRGCTQIVVQTDAQNSKDQRTGKRKQNYYAQAVLCVDALKCSNYWYVYLIIWTERAFKSHLLSVTQLIFSPVFSVFAFNQIEIFPWIAN